MIEKALILTDKQILEATQLGWKKDVEFKDFGYLSGRKQVAEAQRDADHKYYLKQFVKLIHPILLSEVSLGMKVILITNIIASLTEAGEDSESNTGTD